MRSSCPSTSSPQKLAVAATADKPGAPRPHRGKTSTAAELLSLVPSSRVFNPETVGHTLQPNLADQAVSDFQHWPPWRPGGGDRHRSGHRPPDPRADRAPGRQCPA